MKTIHSLVRVKARTMYTICFILLLVMAFSISSASAQEQDDRELSLRMSKTFGYSSGFTYSKIQGVFTISATGPEDLSRVVFYVDDTVIAEDTDTPFEARFTTDDYELGQHSIHAVGYTEGGRELTSNQFTSEFVTSSQGWESALRILVPVLVIALGVTVVGAILPLLSRRKGVEVAPGAEQNYGAAGGAICPRCERPFPLHFLAPNLGPTLKLQACPHCGRFGVVRRRTLETLRAAEAAERKRARPDIKPAESEEERLRRELERTRYEDL